jgi:hypothetical protein
MVYSDMNTAFSRNLEIQKGTCPNGQIPLLIVRELFYSSTAACATFGNNPYIIENK